MIDTQRKHKWYKGYKFPLIPVLEIDHRDEERDQIPGFYFHWLFIRIWTLFHIQFEIGLTLSTHWGVGVIMLLPYLRIVFCIPCPYWIERLVNKLNRKT